MRLRRTRRKERIQLCIGRQWSPDQPALDRNHEVGKARLLDGAGDGRVSRDNEPRHTVASRLRQNMAVTPQPIIGQMRAAPPAVDRIVAAEIFLMGQDGPAELGQRQLGCVGKRRGDPLDFPGLLCAVRRPARPLPASDRVPTLRSNHPNSNSCEYKCAAERAQVKQDIGERKPSCNAAPGIASRLHQDPVAGDGSSANRSSKAGLSIGNALRSFAKKIDAGFGCRRAIGLPCQLAQSLSSLGRRHPRCAAPPRYRTPSPQYSNRSFASRRNSKFFAAIRVENPSSRAAKPAATDLRGLAQTKVQSSS